MKHTILNNIIIGATIIASLGSVGTIAYSNLTVQNANAITAAVNDYNNARTGSTNKNKYGTETVKVTYVTRSADGKSHSESSMDVPKGFVLNTPALGTPLYDKSDSDATTLITEKNVSTTINGKQIDDKQTTFTADTDTTVETITKTVTNPVIPSDVKKKFDAITVTANGKNLVLTNSEGGYAMADTTRAGLQSLKINVNNPDVIVKTSYASKVLLPTDNLDDAGVVIYYVEMDGYYKTFMITTDDKAVNDYNNANKVSSDSKKVYDAGKQAGVSDADWNAFKTSYEEFSDGISDSNPYHDYFPQWFIDVETNNLQAALDKVSKNTGSGNENNNDNNHGNTGNDNNNPGNKPETVDKTSLNDLLKTSESDYNNGADVYMVDSWNAFKTAYDNAKKVSNDENATADQVKTAFNNLKTAHDGLIKKDAGGNDDNNVNKTPTDDELAILKNLKAYYLTGTDTSQGVRNEIKDFDGTKDGTYTVEAGYKGSIYPHVDIDGVPDNWDRTYKYDFNNHLLNQKEGVVLIDTVTTPSGYKLTYTFKINPVIDDNQNNPTDNNQTNNNGNDNTNDNNNVNTNANSNNGSQDNNATTNSTGSNSSNGSNVSTTTGNGSNVSALNNDNSNAGKANTNVSDSSGNLAKTGVTAGVITSIMALLTGAGVALNRAIRRKHN